LKVKRGDSHPGPVLVLCVVWFLCASALIPESGAETAVRVKWVDDGDTILLQDGRRIRYIGINAPEKAHHIPGKRKKAAEPFANKASEANQKLVSGQRLRLEFDAEHHDRYGRVLAYVFLEDGTLVNETMVSSGLAYCLPRDPNNRYGRRLLKAQQKAMTAGKGIWKNVDTSGGIRIGNKKSKRFHQKNCPFGQQMSKRHRIVFRSAWEAFYQGFAPCSKCKGD